MELINFEPLNFSLALYIVYEDKNAKANCVWIKRFAMNSVKMSEESQLSMCDFTHVPLHCSLFFTLCACRNS